MRPDIIEVHLDDSDCRSVVMSPDTGETLTIPFQGLVHIYSNSGKLIKQFNAPGEWDGRDQQGQAVPMGNYVLISDLDRSKIIEVTIIR